VSLDITLLSFVDVIQELEHPPPPGLSEEEGEAREETREKLRIVKTVLEQGGQFSGINRKASGVPELWCRSASSVHSSMSDPTVGGGGGARQHR
jgi:hypothetical protein